MLAPHRKCEQYKTLSIDFMDFVADFRHFHKQEGYKVYKEECLYSPQPQLRA